MVAGGGVGGLVGIICGTGGVLKEEEEEEDEEEEVELLLLSNCRRSINISSSYLMKQISTFSISFFVISVLYYLLLSLSLPLPLSSPSPSLSTSPPLFLSHSYCALIR